MPVDRPTFSESWYRVADLCPRLRSTVQIFRQHFRGRMWHVVQDPSSNQFFRVNEAAYRFIALLDGHRTVAQVWRICNDQLGDSAPTQGEAIQLLGQLYTSNLLQAELPPDAEGLFRRYRKRVRREVQSYLMNLLFIRIPLLDPDHFLNRWVRVLGLVFTWFGFALWGALVAAGLYSVVGRWDELFESGSNILDPGNLPLLYLSMIFIKVFHEFGHAFACKKFGRKEGTRGEVHVMGVMFLVFTPLPYMDASSAWAFRSKRHRVLVGAAGMLVELAIAGIAAMIWARTSAGTVHTIAYNIMFIASVSSLLFNGNFLLRFDAYYIFSDLLEIPNLAQRSKQYLYYLVKKYLWRVRQARNPANTRGERAWMVFYGIASTLYRVFICVRILFFVADKLFILGAILAVVAVVAWVLVPLGKFAHYLATSGELARVRGRAVASTLLTLAAIAAAVGLIPAPDRFRIEGVVEPRRLAIIHAESPGFVEAFLPSRHAVTADAAALLRARNPELVDQLDQLLAERRRYLAERRKAKDAYNTAYAQALKEHLEANQGRIDRVEEDLAKLELHAPFAGTWVSPEVERFEGAYLSRGDRVGLVASLDDVIIRALAEQDFPVDQAFANEHCREVEIRIKGRPRPDDLTGTIDKILPAGMDRLPSAALGYAVGGRIQTAPDDPEGIKAMERFFEVRITPHPGADGKVNLLSGQRVVVRVPLPRKPLALQWWRSLLQLLQRRFHI